MATKTISITEEAYERLAAKKGAKESFSDVILKVTRKAKLSDFAGILTESEAEELKSNIRCSRSKSRARMERIRKRLEE